MISLDKAGEEMDGRKEYQNDRFCLNLARFIMAEYPETAEDTIAAVKNSQGMAEIKTGNWVVTLDYGNGIKNYIIVKEGNPCTTTSIPEWANDFRRKQIMIQQDRNSREVFHVLQAAVRKFDSDFQIGRDYFEEKLEIMEQCYDIPAEAMEIAVLGKLCELAGRYSFDEYGEQARNYIICKFSAMEIAGNVLLLPLCVVTFLQQYKNNQVTNHLSETVYQFVSNARANFLMNPEVSLRTVKELYRSGDVLKEAALDEYTMFFFHKYLYEALLYYRSAYYLGTLLANHGLHDEELDRIVYMCEEMRVMIELSICPIYRNGTPYFFIPENFFAWLGLVPQEKTDPYMPLNRKQIHNMYVDLQYPKLYKDIALEIFKLSQDDAYGLDKLKRYLESMEERKEEFEKTLEGDVLGLLNSYVEFVEKKRKKSM